MNPATSPKFKMLPMASATAVTDEAYSEASVQVLADGSTAINGVAKLEIFGREIWYDIERHVVVKWRNGGVEGRPGPESVDEVPAQTTCTDCACGTQEAGTQEAGTQEAAEFRYPRQEFQNRTYQQQHATAEKFFDVESEHRLGIVELHVNDKCNFRCDYCYLKSAGIEYLDNEMPRDVAEKSVELLIDALPPGGSGVVKFYGGEPFLSYALMRHVVSYAGMRAGETGKRVVFTVNTNGSLLNDEKIQWCKDNHVRVTISLDGNEESNDKYRVYASGNGTYKTVLRKALTFLDEAGYLMLRSTVNEASFQLKDSMAEFGELDGANQKVKFQSDFNLVGKTHVTHADADKLMIDHEQLAMVWVEKLKRGEKIRYGNFTEPMIKAFYTIKTPYRCGAGRTLVSVSPKGAIYPCHRFVGVDDLSMGDVETGFDGRQRQEFIDNRVEHKEPCNKCWARYFCGGGCAFNNYFTNANIRDTNSVHCKLFRHEVKLGLYMYTELHEMHSGAKGAVSDGRGPAPVAHAGAAEAPAHAG